METYFGNAGSHSKKKRAGNQIATDENKTIFEGLEVLIHGQASIEIGHRMC